MENIRADCKAGAIDAVVHMGDHAYNIGFSQDRRGDAYMNAFQPALTTCPWFPIIGNHEGSDGDHTRRYLNLTWGEAYANPLEGSSSTATSALGHGLMARSEPMLSTCHGVSLLSDRSSSKSEGVMLSAVRLRDRVVGAGDSSKLWPLGRIFEKAGEHPDE